MMKKLTFIFVTLLSVTSAWAGPPENLKEFGAEAKKAYIAKSPSIFHESGDEEEIRKILGEMSYMVHFIYDREITPGAHLMFICDRHTRPMGGVIYTPGAEYKSKEDGGFELVPLTTGK